jgi:hypothetical protein
LGSINQSVEESVHLVPGFVIKPKANRTADDGVLKNSLSDQEMFFHGQEGIEAWLHGDERGQRTVNAIGRRRIPGSESARNRWRPAR